MKKWIIRILLIVLTFSLVNDFGWYLKGMYTLDRYGREATFRAATIARANRLPNSGWPTAWQIASDHGIEFVSYQQGPTGVTAIGRIWVGGTFIIGPVYAVLTRQPISSPFPLQQSFNSVES